MSHRPQHQVGRAEAATIAHPRELLGPIGRREMVVSCMGRRCCATLVAGRLLREWVAAGQPGSAEAALELRSSAARPSPSASKRR